VKSVQLNINGKPQELNIDFRQSLLDASGS
jgi:hypothetical protein